MNPHTIFVDVKGAMNNTCTTSSSAPKKIQDAVANPEFAGRAQYVACKQYSKAVLARVTTPSIGQHESSIIARDLFAAIESGHSRTKWLVIDLSAVSVLSSMGLALCVDARTRAKEKGMKTVLYGLNGHLRELFRMMRVERLYKLVHSKDDLKKLIDR